MSLEMGARVKVAEKEYGFAPEADFEGIEYINGTDFKCTKIIRGALYFCGIDLRGLDGFMVLPQDDLQRIKEGMERFTRHILGDPDEKEYILNVAKFIEVCIQKGYYIIIG